MSCLRQTLEMHGPCGICTNCMNPEWNRASNREILDVAERVLAEATIAQAKVEQAMREWISMSRYATKYGITRHTLYKWMDAGVVQFYRVDHCVRVRDQPPGKAA